MAVAWAFVADRHSPIDLKNHSLVNLSLKGSLLGGIMSLMTSDFRSVCALDRELLYDRLLLGGPICLAASKVASLLSTLSVEKCIKHPPTRLGEQQQYVHVHPWYSV